MTFIQFYDFLIERRILAEMLVWSAAKKHSPNFGKVRVFGCVAWMRPLPGRQRVSEGQTHGLYLTLYVYVRIRG